MKLPTLYANKFRNVMHLNNLDFSALLLKHNALIAGGSVLSALVNTVFNDFDMYVHVDSSQQFIQDLENYIKSTGLEYEIGYNYVSTYDDSFMSKNGIMFRFHFTFKRNIIYDINVDQHGVENPLGLDVMVVDRSPLKVVNNFDLTIVQSWYDGVDVYTSHPNETLSKISYLNEEYQDAYESGNNFIEYRMDKYIDRKFAILEYVTPFPPNKKINEAWVIRKLYKLSDSYTKEILSGPDSMTMNIPKDFTAKEFKRTFKLNDVQFFNALKKLVNSFYYQYSKGMDWNDGGSFETTANEKYGVPMNEEKDVYEMAMTSNYFFTNAGQIEYYRYLSPMFDYLVRYTKNHVPDSFKDNYPGTVVEYISDHDKYHGNEQYLTVEDYDNKLGQLVIGLDHSIIQFSDAKRDSYGLLERSPYMKKVEKIPRSPPSIDELDEVKELDINLDNFGFVPTKISPGLGFIDERMRKRLSPEKRQKQIDRDAWRQASLADYYKSLGQKAQHNNVYGLRPSEVEDVLNNIDPKWTYYIPSGFEL